MEKITIPSTVEDILKWKNGINEGNWPKSVEDYNDNYTKKCGGSDMTDVFFSFLGLYAIGVWVFNKHIDGLFKIEKNKIKTLRENKKGYHQILCSKRFLLSLQSEKINNIDVVQLNECLKEFSNKYFDVGNLIPMWPGGNCLKGNQNKGFMDIPEIFFRKYLYWYGKLADHSQSWLSGMNERVKDTRFDSLKDFLSSIDSPEKYINYINDLVNIIEDRTEQIINSENRY